MSCPYTSPENGKAKRIIHSLNNVFRTLLIQASLLRRYWVEGLHTATYMLNRLPTNDDLGYVSSSCPIWFRVLLRASACLWLYVLP
jgi:hypothetical protein